METGYLPLLPRDAATQAMPPKSLDCPTLSCARRAQARSLASCGLCSERLIPVTARGAGTGLAGGCSPVRGGIVLDMSGMNRILEMDIENQQVIVEPGVVADEAQFGLKALRIFLSARSWKPGHVHHRRNDLLQQQRHALCQIWNCEKLRP